MTQPPDAGRRAYFDRVLIHEEVTLGHDHGAGLFCVEAVVRERDGLVASWRRVCEEQHRTVDGRRIVWRER